MGFQIGDVWGRVARVQRTWPSGGVLSSAFLPSALKAVKRTAKQTQKQMISEYDFTSAVELTLWLFYHNRTWMHKTFYGICAVPPSGHTFQEGVFEPPGAGPWLLTFLAPRMLQHHLC